MTLPAAVLSPSPPPAPQSASVKHGLDVTSPKLRPGRRHSVDSSVSPAPPTGLSSSVSPAPPTGRRRSIDSSVSPAPPTGRRHSIDSSVSLAPPTGRRRSNASSISPATAHRRHSVDTAGSSPPRLQQLEKRNHRRNSLQTTDTPKPVVRAWWSNVSRRNVKFFKKRRQNSRRQIANLLCCIGHS